jgi:hypothetical protein
MAIPNWLKLVRAWRDRGRSGLTLEFLCAACGMQPEDLLEQVYLQQMPVEYCHLIGVPLVGWRARANGQRGFTIVEDAQYYLLQWLDPRGPGVEWWLDDSGMYSLLVDYVHAQLAEGKPSVHNVRLPNGWNHFYRNGPFTGEDKAFIKRVLGHDPPEITGVGRTGRIQYSKCYS